MIILAALFEHHALQRSAAAWHSRRVVPPFKTLGPAVGWGSVPRHRATAAWTGPESPGSARIGRFGAPATPTSARRTVVRTREEGGGGGAVKAASTGSNVIYILLSP